MASKAERKLADVDAVFGALAHASRRHILLVLHYRGGEITAGEVAARFDCTWPTTTRHLGVLLDAGLIEKHHRGRQRLYRVDHRRLRQVTTTWLDVFESDE